MNGDQQAFSELVSRYKKLIYKVVYNIVNNDNEVNDIAQEVFLKIYKSLDSYNPEYKFSTWAVKITTNYCLDVVRKRKVEIVPIEEIEGVSSNADTPETHFIKKERNQRIQEAVSELPEKYRIPIILFHQNGLSYEELMKVLNEPMSIIKNRLYRARLILREKLLSERKEGAL
jgi:RNA polymerase sigma-70 factor (ECF subfamily)